MKTLMPLHLKTSVRVLPALFAACTMLLLTACGDDAKTVTGPDLSHDIDPATYSGPAPLTDDVNAYKQFLWNNIAVANRCGGCHGVGGQSPQFVRDDNINEAYRATNPLVDLANPEASRLVVRVAGGHNCWSDDLDLCADVMTTYIRNWAMATVGGPAATVVLTAPPVSVPGATKNFPATSTLFSTTVYPVLTEYCAGCHSPSAGTPQAPFFAAEDVEAAYAAARNSINLNDPARSRFVQRIGNEFHNCWDDCAANAIEMRDAIIAMSNDVFVTPLPSGIIASHALGLRQGIVASSGGRHETNVIAKYEFKTGSGNIVRDTSGIAPALDLTLSGATEWVGGWGMRFDGGKAQASTTKSGDKLHTLLTASGEYSIEAWVAPANVTQEGPARIVSYSGGEGVRNFMLGQSMYNYDFHNRNALTDADGAPSLSTADAAERLQATLQHVVITYSAAGGRRIYVNGEYTGDADPAGGGTLGNWNKSYALVLGSEIDGSDAFRGTLRMVAIHSRALNAEQIAQNFLAGVGERFYLLFGIGHLLPDTPSLFVMFEGSQFDSYSYLFAAPKLVSLDPDYVPNGLPLAGMRLGINGHEAGFGQAYQPLDLVIDEDTWLAGSGDELSRIGTVIPLEDGADFDQFFLTFERLGALTHTVTETTPLAPDPVAGDAVPDIGLRLFETINASLSAITTIPSTDTNVAAMYNRVKQQMPASDLLAGFSSAQQVGITQLAIEYCNSLVEDPMSTVYFGTFNLNAPFTTAFNTPAKRSALINPLILHVANTGLLSMPDVVDIETELNALVDRLIGSCTGTCALTTNDQLVRTKTIAKAVCTAAAGNAAMLLL